MQERVGPPACLEGLQKHNVLEPGIRRVHAPDGCPCNRLVQCSLHVACSVKGEAGHQRRDVGAHRRAGRCAQRVADTVHLLPRPCKLRRCVPRLHGFLQVEECFAPPCFSITALGNCVRCRLLREHHSLQDERLVVCLPRRDCRQRVPCIEPGTQGEAAKVSEHVSAARISSDEPQRCRHLFCSMHRATWRRGHQRRPGQAVREQPHVQREEVAAENGQLLVL